MKTITVSNNVYKEFIMLKKITKELFWVHDKLEKIYGDMGDTESGIVTLKANNKYSTSFYNNLDVKRTCIFLETILEGQTDVGLDDLREMFG